MSAQLCHCGKPLHYANAETQRLVEQFIRDMGEDIPVTLGEKTYLVPRHFIALHGLAADELPTLGFRERP